MAKRNRVNGVWVMNRAWIGRNGGVMRSPDTDKIHIWFRPAEGRSSKTLDGMTTREARLLAKRINQFIDAGS